MHNPLRKRYLILIILWFVLLAVVFTWPLVLHMKQEIVGEIGDNIYFVWMIGWVKKALFDQHVNPMNVWFLNYPEGWNLASTEMAPAQLALALPFSFIGGETFGYNMAMLLSFVLAGLMMFGWIRHLTGSSFAGLLSGTIYACLPYWQAHFLAGHLNLCGTQWIPLFFWGWFDMLQPGLGKFRKKAALKAGLGLGLTALCSQYYIYMLILVAAGMGIIFILFKEIPRLKDAAFWKTLGLFVLVAAPLLLIAELPFLTLAGSGRMPDRNWGNASMYSASVTDFLLPATTHFAMGSWISRFFNRDLWIEASLYIGIISLLLFIYGAVRRKPDRRWIWFLLICGILVSVLLAMGTDLHWNEQPVMIPVPEFLQGITGSDTIRFFLPGIVLFKFFPFFNKMRALMRFGLFALILFAAGAGLGGMKLIRRGKPKTSVLIGSILLLLVVLDFLPTPYQNFSQVNARPVDLWLAEQPDTGSVMNVPFELNDDQAGTYYTLKHGKPFIGGFFNAFPTYQYQRIQGTMERFPSQESLAEAKTLDVAYFLVDIPEMNRHLEEDAKWQSVDEFLASIKASGLVELADFGEIVVFGWNDENS